MHIEVLGKELGMDYKNLALILPQRIIYMCVGHGVGVEGESPLWADLKRSIS